MTLLTHLERIMIFIFMIRIFMNRNIMIRIFMIRIAMIIPVKRQLCIILLFLLLIPLPI